MDGEVERVGSGLHRPECVLATATGDLYTSDRRGVSQLHPGGRLAVYTGHSAELSGPIVPNGIALEPDGSFLLAHLGADAGGVFRLRRDGQLTPVLREVDGAPLPPTNFVTRDRLGHLWTTVSTRLVPRAAAYRPDVADGFLVLDDGRGPRIVADGLGYTNKCAITPDVRTLYVNETFARRLTRYPVRDDGSLGSADIVAEFGPGEFPDGLALDQEGGVWIACVVGNRILRIAPGGQVTTWLDAGVPGHVTLVESAYTAGTMGAEHLGGGGSPLGNCSSLAFSGRDRRTAFLGSLQNDHLTRLPVPISGVEPVHWLYR